jgi:hypothetical protein
MGGGSIYSEFYNNIQGAFNEYGGQIMSLPCRFDPARPRIVPKGKWYAPLAKPPDDQEKYRKGAQHEFLIMKARLGRKEFKK